MKHILSAVQSISDDVLALLAGLPTATDESRELARLETLMAMNHGLLNAMGVGHAALEAVCQITAAVRLFSFPLVTDFRTGWSAVKADGRRRRRVRHHAIARGRRRGPRAGSARRAGL